MRNIPKDCRPLIMTIGLTTTKKRRRRRRQQQQQLCTLVFSCLYGVAPVYLPTTCQPVSTNIGHRSRRSTVRGDLVVPVTRTPRYGPYSFAVVGSSTWNSLPASMHDHTLTLTSFRRQLKTFLFSRALHYITNFNVA